MAWRDEQRQNAVGPAAFFALVSAMITVMAAFMPWIENRVGSQNAFSLQPSALAGGSLTSNVEGISLGILLLVCAIGLLASAFAMGTRAGGLLAATCMFGQVAISLAWVLRFSEHELGNIVGVGAWTGLLAASFALLSAVLVWTGLGMKVTSTLMVRR